MTELFTSNLKLFNDTTATALNNKQLFLNKLKNEKVHPDFIYLSETDQDLLASSACKILYLIKECEKFFSGLKLRLISENSLNSGKVVEMENMLESFKNIMWY
ncbi:hypothetical protein HK099_005699 [Clydaea vesicula]|uniref:Uncharacterized protein n=1 Tax=Clydaea vesicula TaxID=447962 RepID=A0AAD5XUR7_9FUNG|nr:hypothetical protein HK099_005699 [Clydaea vesicula]